MLDLLVSVLIYLVALNALGFIISAPLKTEKLYDLAGSLSFAGAVILAFSVGYQYARQTILLVCVLLWAIRLGTLLAIRAFKIGDHRFDDIKVNPLIFAGLWFGQILWAYITAFPVYLAMRSDKNGFGTPTDVIGIILYIVGFSLEIAADHQKSAFKKNHPSDPIMTGLYKFVRFPNYFGEWVLWIGINLMSISGFSENWQYVGLVSIPFVFVLLRFGSGVGITAKSQNERYGTRPDFQEYIKKTNLFFPWIARK